MSRDDVDWTACQGVRSAAPGDQVVRADLNGDGIADYATLLKIPGAKSTSSLAGGAADAWIRLVVFLGRKNGTFRAMVLEMGEGAVLPLSQVITVRRPGVVRQYDEARTVTLALPSIERFYCESSATVIYWSPRARGFRQIWTGD